jgi:hypothetical protein
MEFIGCLYTPNAVLFSAPYIPAGMIRFRWNPPESTGMGQESTGMGPESTGIMAFLQEWN